MEWVATSIAVIAAAAAIWQGLEARRARRGAQAAAREAEDATERTVAAAERLAKATEDQAALALAAYEQYENPWALVPRSMGGAKAWDWRLGGGEPVSNLRAELDPDDGDVDFVAPVPTEMSPGESIGFFWAQTYDSPAQVTVALHWQRPNGDAHSTRMTLR